MTKSFTPTQLHQNPAKVFRAADKDGSVLIKHDRYQDVVFVLTAKDKPDSQLGEKLKAASAFAAEAYGIVPVEEIEQ